MQKSQPKNKKALKLKITTLGGGTGNSITLSALKNSNCELATIVNVADNGGSSGRLRKELNVLPPGDARQCLIALSNAPDEITKILNMRFAENNLKGHAFGNILLASLEKTYGNMEKAIEIISRSLNLSAKIIPATLTKSNLCLKNNKKIIFGEREIYNTKIAKLKKIKFFLKPKAAINPAAAKTIKKTDYLIISPGNLYCSLIPILLADGMTKTIKNSSAKIILIPNLANIKNHTDNFSLENYIEIFSHYLTKLPNFVIINNNTDFVNKHSTGGEAVIIKNEKDFRKNFPGVKIIKKDLANKKLYEKDKNDALERTLVRHDPVKLAAAIKQICAF